MTSYKVVQNSNREEFRNYLEKMGVISNLTECLVKLYEEPNRPPYPLDYIRQSLSVNSPDKVELETLRLSVEELKQKLALVERANEELREKLAAAGVETGSVIEQSVEDMTEDAVTGQTAATGNSSVHDHQ